MNANLSDFETYVYKNPTFNLTQIRRGLGYSLNEVSYMFLLHKTSFDGIRTKLGITKRKEPVNIVRNKKWRVEKQSELFELYKADAARKYKEIFKSSLKEDMIKKEVVVNIQTLSQIRQIIKKGISNNDHVTLVVPTTDELLNRVVDQNALIMSRQVVLNHNVKKCISQQKSILNKLKSLKLV